MSKKQLIDPVLSEKEKDKFSRVVFSVKVERSLEGGKYPYVYSVWESGLGVPINMVTEDIKTTVGAWTKMMETGLEVSRLINKGKIK